MSNGTRAAIEHLGAAERITFQPPTERRVTVEEGKPAPDFELTSDAGETVKLSALRGKPVVLYFYPKDDTPGLHGAGVRDPRRLGRVRARGAVVLGVSPDDERSHVKFKEKYDLPFTLLADTDHATAEDYGVWVEKTYAGKTYMGVERSTFVIDADGNVAKEMRRVKPDTHADDVLAAARVLASAPAAAGRGDRAARRARGRLGRGGGRAALGCLPRRRAGARGADAARRSRRTSPTARRRRSRRRPRSSVRSPRQRPDWAPRSLLDVGAGPGVAAWAAVAAWPSLTQLTLVEAEPEMIAAGRELLPARAGSQATSRAARGPADLVVASYVLGELPNPVAAAAHLWGQSADTIVFVEPGTPAGYRRILAARAAVIEAGGCTVAPCPHDLAVPAAGGRLVPLRRPPAPLQAPPARERRRARLRGREVLVRGAQPRAGREGGGADHPPAASPLGARHPRHVRARRHPATERSAASRARSTRRRKAPPGATLSSRPPAPRP